jgi:hypothetical protein
MSTMMEDIYTLMKSSTMAHGSLFKFDGKDLQSNFGLQQYVYYLLAMLYIGSLLKIKIDKKLIDIWHAMFSQITHNIQVM